MNILYSGDGNTVDGIMISALSLCKTVREPLHIYILTSSVRSGERECEPIRGDFPIFLEAELREYNREHTVELFDISELFAADLPTANMETRFTPCCMLRLYADLVDALPDKVLYLDNDVVCRADPFEFYSQNMDGVSIAGVLDFYGSWFFRKNIFARDYLNSGVLLCNMKRIRENGLFARCREMCRTEKMFMPDQSALNELCDDKRICPRRYNEQRRMKKNTVFRHFTTTFRLFPWFHSVSVKPWNIDGMHDTLKIHEFDQLLGEYLSIKEKYIYEQV